MRLLLCLLLVLSSSTKLANAQLVTNCPPCFHNMAPFEVVDPSDITPDGRMLLRVAANTFAMNTDEASKVSTGIEMAAVAWGSSTSTGDRIPYKFESESNQNQADFVVQFGVPNGGCAEIDVTVFPHIIKLSTAMLGKPLDDVAKVIAHELGHRIGLQDTCAGGSAECQQSTSIMTCSPGGCNSAVNMNISGKDIDQVKRNFNTETRNTCTATSPHQPAFRPDPCDQDNNGCLDVACGGDNCESECLPPGCNWPEVSNLELCCCSEIPGGPCTSTPIIIDLEGDGFDLTNAVDGVNFNLNRSRKDWHRQFLSGTTVFVQKTVPKETVRAFDYRT
jgi:hypothetical protein